MISIFWLRSLLIGWAVRHNEIWWICWRLVDCLHDWHHRNVTVSIFLRHFISGMLILEAYLAFVDTSIWLVRDVVGNLLLSCLHLSVVGFDLLLFLFYDFFLFSFLKLFLASSFLNLLIQNGFHLPSLAFELLFFAEMHFLEENTSNMASVLQFLHSWRVIHCYINLRNYVIISKQKGKPWNLTKSFSIFSILHIFTCTYYHIGYFPCGAVLFYLVYFHNYFH